MDYPDYPKQKRQSGNNTALGLGLLLPLILVLLVMQLRPAIGTLMMSFQRIAPFGDRSIYIGFENYSRMFSDASFGEATKYTFFIIITRIGVLLFVPAIVGFLVGIQGKIGRILNRVVLGVLAAFISPVALVTLWRFFWGMIWGREPSPISRDLLEIMMPRSPTSAVTSTLLLDAIITMGIAVVVGAILYIAVLRGRETHSRNAMKVGIAVWIIGLLYAVGSALNAFIIPYILTRGGPVRSTTSMFLLNFEQGFQRFNFGVAATQAILTMIPVIVGVVIVWGLITAFRIRVIRVSDNGSQSQAQSSGLSAISLPMIALIFLPITGLLLWGHYIAFTNDGFSESFEMMNWGRTLLNLFVPILVIWLVQIPITYLAAAALGLMRPVNRMVTNILFLILLVLAFIPPETLLFQWFMDARDLGILNTQVVLAMPWLVSGLSFLVFKLFFDGMYDEVQAARESGQGIDTILQKVVMASLPLVLLMGLVATFMSIQNLLWPLIATNGRDNFTPTLMLTMISNQFATENAPLAGAAVILVDIFFIPFALGFGLISGFGLENLALVGGDADTEQAAQPMPYSNQYASPIVNDDDDDLGLDEDIPSAPPDDDDLGLDDDDLEL